MPVPPPRPVRVLRVIARLNVGGPAIQVINLTRRLAPLGYDTVLLRGKESALEGTMDHLADELGVQPRRVPGLRRGLGWHDLVALRSILGWLRTMRPDILHTHTAKAGTLGRLAVLLAPWWRPRVVVHTFHGHVLKGEFGPRLSRMIARFERVLARLSTRVIAVSEEIADDLVAFGVAPREKIEVVHLGFDLSRFAERDDERAAIRSATRRRLGIAQEALVVTVIARVVKVKRIDRFIEMAGLIANRDVVFLVAGDGDRRAELEASEAARALGDRLVWAGFERDIGAICFASDVVALTSDNEGTPVCLIEAQACAVPVVTTDAGGVATVVLDCVSGRIVSKDAAALSNAVSEFLDDESLRAEYGRRGREHALAAFSVDRLVGDIDRLYSRLLAARSPRSAIREGCQPPQRAECPTPPRAW